MATQIEIPNGLTFDAEKNLILFEHDDFLVDAFKLADKIINERNARKTPFIYKDVFDSKIKYFRFITQRDYIKPLDTNNSVNIQFVNSPISLVHHKMNDNYYYEDFEFNNIYPLTKQDYIDGLYKHIHCAKDSIIILEHQINSYLDEKKNIKIKNVKKFKKVNKKMCQKYFHHNNLNVRNISKADIDYLIDEIKKRFNANEDDIIEFDYKDRLKDAQDKYKTELEDIQKTLINNKKAIDEIKKDIKKHKIIINDLKGIKTIKIHKLKKRRLVIKQ